MPLSPSALSPISCCHQIESTLFQCKIEDVWNRIKTLDFEHLVPKSVSKVNGKVIVGEKVKLEFKDDTSMEIRILELSELQHFVTWEMIECTPPVNVTSVINKIKLCKVTDMNATFMTWETEFSNDADMSLYQD